MSFNDAFEILKGRIDRVRLGPKEDFDFRFLRPLKGDYVNAAGDVFTAQETFDAGYEPFDEPVCSSTAPYVNNGILQIANPPSGEVGTMVNVGSITLGSGLGNPVDYPIAFTAPDGNTYNVVLQVTRIGGGGGTPVLNTAVSNIAASGGHNYRYRLIAGADVLGEVPTLRWAVKPSSLNGGGETFQVVGGVDSFPTDFVAGGNSNATQADWDNQTGIFDPALNGSFTFTNTNNQSTVSAFEFTGSDVSFILNTQSGVGAGLVIHLLEGPSYDICLCEKVEELKEEIAALPITADSSTGVFGLGSYDTTFTVDGIDRQTDLDLTQALGMDLHITVVDAGTPRAWQTGVVPVDSIMAAFNSGDAVDFRMNFFDNDFLIGNVIDPALGILNITDNGRQFDIVKMELRGPAIPTEVTSFAQASLVGQNGNQANAAYDLTTGLTTIGTRWTANAEDFTLSGAASYVELSAMATYTYDAADGNVAALQRVAPILELHKNGVLVAASATAYQRHTSGHNDSSNTITHTDLSPAVGDVWELRMTQGATQNDVLNVTHGQFTAKAVG